MRLVSVPTDAVPALWPAVAGMIDRSCRRGLGEMTADELRLECEAGRARLMIAAEGSRILMAGAVSLGRRADGVLEAHILACGGAERDAWLHTLADLEDWARHHGATSLRFTGRPGWARVIAGYRVAQVTMSKAL